MCGGLTAVIRSGVTVMAVGWKPPNRTAVPLGRKSRPLITTEVPPKRGLVVGAAVVIDGPEKVSRPMAVPHWQLFIPAGACSAPTQTSVASVGSHAAPERLPQ